MQMRLRLGWKDCALHQSREQSRGVLGAERRQRDRVRVALAAAPPGRALVQLGPGGAQNEQRNARRPVDEVLDEREQLLVGPVQILEDGDQRALRRNALEEALPGPERRLG